jgi:hypothetical protein
MAQDFVEHTQTLSVTVSTQVSSSFQLRKDRIFVGLYIADISDSANVTIDVSPDNADWAPILDILDGEALVIMASGTDTGYIDITNLVASIPDSYYLRLGFSVAQDPALTAAAYVIERS